MPRIQPRSIPAELEARLLQSGLSALEARLYAARGISEPTDLEHELARCCPLPA